MAPQPDVKRIDEANPHVLIMSIIRHQHFHEVDVVVVAIVVTITIQLLQHFDFGKNLALHPTTLQM